MSEVPELTDDEATAVRFALLHVKHGSMRVSEICSGVASRIVIVSKDGVSDEGCTALAAHDKRKTAQIRADAMRETEDLVANWKAYADLFSEQVDRIIPYAIAHGWRGDPDLYERGKEIRARLGIHEPEVK